MEREEREQKERERREQKAYEKEQRRIAKEKARAAKEAARIEEAAIAAADKLSWLFFIPSEDKVGEDDQVDEPFELMLMAKKKAYHPAAVVDAQNWEALEVYLRAQFEVDDTRSSASRSWSKSTSRSSCAAPPPTRPRWPTCTATSLTLASCCSMRRQSRSPRPSPRRRVYSAPRAHRRVTQGWGKHV